MELDINMILELYKERVATLEHETLLQKVLITQLEREIENMRKVGIDINRMQEDMGEEER